jgi:phage shock protein A
LGGQVSPTAEDEVARIIEELCKELRGSKSAFLRTLVIERLWLEKRVADLEASLARLEEEVEWLSHMVKKLDDRVWWILGIILGGTLGLLLKLI